MTSPASLPGYPAAYLVDARRPDVFDPALAHHAFAFIKGPLPASDEARSLSSTRSRLHELALQALARSPVRDLVVLRGSLALEAWFPDHARRAHDLDLVVRDAALDPASDAAEELLGALRRAIHAALAADDARVLGDEITVDSIWTYERAEGRRIAIPWSFAGGARDVIQIDVVFREPLQDAPALEALRDDAPPGGYREAPKGGSLWFATRAESLAWKLLWLESDRHPQAKDLHDALLLAEHVSLPLELARRVYAGKGEIWDHGANPDFVRSWQIEWESFALEYPELSTGSVDAWLERLAGALKITG
jgi:hypothetical protein